MTISVGDRFPDAQLSILAEDGPKLLGLSDYVAGRKVIVFGLPGAFTGPCSTAHVPSFIRTAEAFKEKGIDEIICIAVNDPFVLKAWGEATGATAAGITMLGDAEGKLTHALKMEFTAPQIGLIGRSNRYAVVLDDGVVTHANVDEPGVCDISKGEQLLETM
ncbi:redoxin family protein [Rhodobacterales bacterium HKCCSP123]|nr:redoxin family protein [Rhodobacterales bacterium HKCCSP123]